MSNIMSAKSIFINLPSKDIEKTRLFWTKLGFTFNEQFCDDKALCLVLNEGSIYVMFLADEYFSTFTNRPIADGTTTQVLLAINVGSRAKVDEMVRKALDNGAIRYQEPNDEGWMYVDRFADIDGHQWEVMCADESYIEKE
jgi:predicted lactoylglutathione lyase